MRCAYDDSCPESGVSRGLCASHYAQERKAGNLHLWPLVMPTRSHHRPLPTPPVSLTRLLDEARDADVLVDYARPCRRGCCWTPFGHSRAATDCTCHLLRGVSDE